MCHRGLSITFLIEAVGNLPEKAGGKPAFEGSFRHSVALGYDQAGKAAAAIVLLVAEVVKPFLVEGLGSRGELHDLGRSFKRQREDPLDNLGPVSGNAFVYVHIVELGVWNFLRIGKEPPVHICSSAPLFPLPIAKRKKVFPGRKNALENLFPSYPPSSHAGNSPLKCDYWELKHPSKRVYGGFRTYWVIFHPSKRTDKFHRCRCPKTLQTGNAIRSVGMIPVAGLPI